jgi:hypothetical protein
MLSGRTSSLKVWQKDGGRKIKQKEFSSLFGSNACSQVNAYGTPNGCRAQIHSVKNRAGGGLVFSNLRNRLLV